LLKRKQAIEKKPKTKKQNAKSHDSFKKLTKQQKIWTSTKCDKTTNNSNNKQTHLSGHSNSYTLSLLFLPCLVRNSKSRCQCSFVVTAKSYSREQEKKLRRNKKNLLEFFSLQRCNFECPSRRRRRRRRPPRLLPKKHKNKQTNKPSKNNRSASFVATLNVSTPPNPPNSRLQFFGLLLAVLQITSV
jgi:hypothetical protein